MFDKILYVTTLLANAVLLLVLAALFFDAHGEESLLIALMAAVPVLSLVLLYKGPDREERRLRRQVNKARLRKELAELEK